MQPGEMQSHYPCSHEYAQPHITYGTTDVTRHLTVVAAIVGGAAVAAAVAEQQPSRMHIVSAL